MSDTEKYPTPPRHELTLAEVQIIKDTWKIPNAKPHDSAELIFYTFLERYPEQQQKFPAFRNKLLADLKGKPVFRSHASRIFNVFDSVIDCLDNDPEGTEIPKIIADIGISHLKRKVTKESYTNLRTVIEEILSHVCSLDENGKTAWRKLLDIFFNVIFECIDGRSEQFM